MREGGGGWRGRDRHPPCIPTCSTKLAFISVRYQGDATSRNKSWGLPHADSTSRPIGTQCGIALPRDLLRDVCTLPTEMSVPCLSASPGTSILVLRIKQIYMFQSQDHHQTTVKTSLQEIKYKCVIYSAPDICLSQFWVQWQLHYFVLLTYVKWLP